MNENKYKELLALAKQARGASYCPYSHFAVGAALLTADNKVYLGANIENASSTPTVCAERVAFFKAVSEGERSFTAIAIVGGREGEPSSDPTPPCGVCRQVMAEFVSDDFKIILEEGENAAVYTMAEILPLRFDKTNLD